MDRNHHPLQLQWLLLLSTTLHLSLAVGPPNTVVTYVFRESSTSTYIVFLHDSLHGTSHVLDISGSYVSATCTERPHPPTYPCNSTVCAAARSATSSPLCRRLSSALPTTPRPPARSCTCTVQFENPVDHGCVPSSLSAITMNVSMSHGSYPTAAATVGRLTTLCTTKAMLRSLPSYADGVAGLGRSRFSLPSQLSAALSIKNKFTLCLTRNNIGGLVLFGDDLRPRLHKLYFVGAPYVSYTPLKRNIFNTVSHFIGLRGIDVGGKPIDLPADAFEFDSLGDGGIELSTTVLYSTLRRDVYKAFLRAYEVAAAKAKITAEVTKVKPFEHCVKRSALRKTNIGYVVPVIELVVEGGGRWNVTGWNSIVEVGEDMACLAFVDGGWRAKRAVTIGGYQMENNFLLFDLERSRLGFGNAFAERRITCSIV